MAFRRSLVALYISTLHFSILKDKPLSLLLSPVVVPYLTAPTESALSVVDALVACTRGCLFKSLVHILLVIPVAALTG